MIGLYGGTFAPVHNGHLRFAIEARERLGLEAVHMLACAQPPHRDKPGIDGPRRHAWLEQAVADVPGLVADDDELRHDGPSYTVDTLRRARARFPEQTCVWLLGADAFNSLHGWHRWQELFAYAHLVVAARPGHALTPHPEVAAYPQVEIAALRQQRHGCWHAIAIPEMDIAASAIRARLREGACVRGLVPDRVLDTFQDTDFADLAAQA
ncbi:nicotinate-nucleotide adenylyltransferase [Algiphilus sp.]|uniref:nicotinate-nucleotide adenylyltransferase n=1 Tax=Algiphilus sp. TaxID=1872431 RepID=UPI0032ECF9D2